MGVHENWTIVDLLFREFYTGSDKELSVEEREILESLFTTKFYVQREIEYSYITVKGEANASTDLPKAYANWTGYLERYRPYIVSGTHLTSFAVQEPAGIMILKANYGEKAKSGESSDLNPYYGTGSCIWWKYNKECN